jgi:hypothetical protein
MSVQISVEQAQARLSELREAVSALRVTVTEDKPTGDEAVIVTWLDDMVTELEAELDEANKRLTGILESELGEGSLAGARSGLREAHRSVNRCSRLYVIKLAAHGAVERLAQMGRERGRAWRDWVGVVKSAIERCAEPLAAAQEAILDCWREIAETLARNSVSVRATNIGQQITVSENQAELSGKAA